MTKSLIPPLVECNANVAALEHELKFARRLRSLAEKEEAERALPLDQRPKDEPEPKL